MKALFLALIVSLVAGGAPKKKDPRFLPEGEALERLSAIEFHRNGKDPFLAQALYHHSRTVVEATILAHGRIGDPASVEHLAPFLTHARREYKMLAAFALSLVGGDVALALLSQYAQMDPDAASRAAFWEAAGRIGNESTVRLFHNALATEKSASSRQRLCKGLGLLWDRSEPGWETPPGLLATIAGLAKADDDTGLACAFALSRYRGDPEGLPVADLQAALKANARAESKALLVRVLARTTSDTTAALLSEMLRTSAYHALREEAAKALGFQRPSPETLSALKKALMDTHSSVRVNALVSLLRYGSAAAPLATDVEQSYTLATSDWVRATAIRALAAVKPEAARAHLKKLFADGDSPLYTAGLRALGILGTDLDLAKLIAHLSHDRTEYVAKAAEALGSLSSNRFTKEAKGSIRKALSRGDVAVTAMIADLVRQYQWTEFAPDLAAMLPKFPKETDAEARIAILNTLAELKVPDTAKAVKPSIQDPIRVVASAAAEAYRSISGETGGTPPLNSRLTGISPPIEEMQKASRSRVVLKTTRGEIEIALSPRAPMNAYNFVELVKQKFYDGKTFHRVVPNFVVQGGDPRGDGYGGPGYFVRDEVTSEVHERGTVGLATAGKDTDRSQFFINLNPNLHLDGRYTLFGRVVSGMAVADRLEIGDKILSARVK